ncbi:MAG TPA: competence protein, partial [Cyanobacteria bacterium UBA11049]|nr:competence protein [Cyanobacteria bacterium UBA11049]
PGVNDISKFITSGDKALPGIVTVRGNITSSPRLTRSQRGQFWLEATQLDIENESKEVTGNLYVTVPLLQVTGLHEGEAIAVTGSLYKPKPATNPGGFDFQAYLAQEGSFAGLKGREVILLNRETNSSWGWWAIRQRIIHSQGRWLGMPEAPLVSAMVLGNRVVDLPFNITDSFITVGLAHALAASGFQVSLILGVVLNLTKRFSNQIQFSFGVTALLIFVSLTGLQPSVLRATLMGIGALIALVLQRKTKPLGLILLAGTLLLIIKPIWIWDLGFDFSFLATIGLVVTVPALMKRLDWLPPAIATLIAVPIAAYIWTLPLQLYKFGLVSPYSILVNIITTIPLSIISLGAFISAIAALVPVIGSATAWFLYYPTHGLVEIVNFFSYLPGSTVALGTITVIQLITLYGLIALVCIHKFWQKRWWLAGLIGIVLILIPVWQAQGTTSVTVLAGTEPVVAIQDKGKVLLINSGDVNKARFTVLPFLQQQGVNQIDWAIATTSLSDNNSDWWEILQHLSVKNFYSCVIQPENYIVQLVKAKVGRSHHVKYHYLGTGQKVATSSTDVELLDHQIPTLLLQIQGQTWLILGKAKPEEQKQLALSRKLPHAQVLLWAGKFLDRDLVKAVQPEVAIASSPTLDSDIMSQLRASKAQVFVTGKDGAIVRTPDGKFETSVETIEEKTSAL